MLSRFSDKDIYNTSKNNMRMIINAFLVKGKNIIGPFYNMVTNSNIHKASLHAERNAIKEIYELSSNPYKKPKIIDKKSIYDILVIRKTRKGEIKSARPCFHCLSLMKAVGIKKCHYSTDDNNIIVEKVNDMISIHVSFVTLKYIEEKYPKQWLGNKDYFLKMLIKHTPEKIKKKNWEMFKKHNLINVLPSLKYIVNKNSIIIMNDTNIIHKLLLV